MSKSRGNFLLGEEYTSSPRRSQRPPFPAGPPIGNHRPTAHPFGPDHPPRRWLFYGSIERPRQGSAAPRSLRLDAGRGTLLLIVRLYYRYGSSLIIGDQ